MADSIGPPAVAPAPANVGNETACAVVGAGEASRGLRRFAEAMPTGFDGAGVGAWTVVGRTAAGAATLSGNRDGVSMWTGKCAGICGTTDSMSRASGLGMGPAGVIPGWERRSEAGDVTERPGWTAGARLRAPAALPRADGEELDEPALELAASSADATAGIQAMVAPTPNPATNRPRRREVAVPGIGNRAVPSRSHRPRPPAGAEIAHLIGNPPGELRGPVGTSSPAPSASTLGNLRHGCRVHPGSDRRNVRGGNPLARRSTAGRTSGVTGIDRFRLPQSNRAFSGILVPLEK